MAFVPSFSTTAVEGSLGRATTATAVDFDEDGAVDLVAGHAGEGRTGVVSVHFVDPAALVRTARPDSGKTSLPSPFLPEAFSYATPVVPDFLGAGDFDADGHVDLIVAERGSRALYMLRGDGHGHLLPPLKREVPGSITALVTGEVNRPDGLEDIAVGIEEGGRARVLIFEHFRGALQGEPESFALPAPARSLKLGQFDEGYERDLEIDCDQEALLVRGRDRKLSTGESATALPAVIDRIRIEHSGLSMEGRQADTLSEPTVVVSLRLDGDGLMDCVALVDGEIEPSYALSAQQASFVVETTADTSDANPADGACADVAGHCSLRAAIQEANALAGNDTITFNIGSGTPTIVLTSPLPAITDTVTIDGATGGATRVEVRGVSDPVADGMVISGGNGSLLRGLVLNQCSGVGLRISTGGNTVENCFIGTDSAGGGTVFGNQGGGILITGASASGNLIGGALPSQGNLISNNSSTFGVRIDASASGNTVAGNRIGTDLSGTVALGNPTGVAMVGGAANNVVGGLTGTPGSPPGNLIGGNTVAITLSSGSGNIVRGNLIGSNAAGSSALGQGEITIDVPSGSSNHTIGGPTGQARNVIMGRVTIPTTGIIVQGNYIGTDITGTTSAGAARGILVVGRSAGATIGGIANAPGTPPGNVISSSDGSGILVSGERGWYASATIRGNIIGARADGQSSLPNAVGVSGVYSQLTIGGSGAGEGNLISGNSGAGISTRGTNFIRGNIIGLAMDGMTPLPNGGDGVHFEYPIMSAGSVDVTGNVISSNSGSGIFCNGQFFGSTISGNLIGVGVNGIGTLGNGGDGVLIQNTAGSFTISGNTIATNNGTGVRLINSSVNNRIQRNSIYGNRLLGIDLDALGPQFPNFPLVTRATFSGSTTTVQGTLNSSAGSTWTIEVFANDVLDPTGRGEGKVFVGDTTCTTNSSGSCAWAVVATGNVLMPTATATSSGGSTYEFGSTCAANDSDGDSVSLCRDNCPSVPNGMQGDADADGSGNACDNCPAVNNVNQLDTDHDGAGDACDCRPTDGSNRPPPEISGLTVLRTGTDTISLSWMAESLAGTYSVSRGSIPIGGAGQYGSCLVEGWTSTTYADPQLPLPGGGYFYMIQGQNAFCGLGPLGYTSSDQIRVNSNPAACDGQP